MFGLLNWNMTKYGYHWHQINSTKFSRLVFRERKLIFRSTFLHESQNMSTHVVHATIKWTPILHTCTHVCWKYCVHSAEQNSDLFMVNWRTTFCLYGWVLELNFASQIINFKFLSWNVYSFIEFIYFFISSSAFIYLLIHYLIYLYLNEFCRFY